ncbi:MAG TPA: hypothetical protein VM123_09775 [archaeon]|nr:hypothetical protein [archaeon]
MKRLSAALALSVLVSLFTLAQVQAQVCSPWVLGKGQPDTRYLNKLVRTLYEQSGAATDREKAETIWRYLLTDGRFVEPGMFYHIAGWAYEEPLGEVLDPSKLLNSYGFGLCYQVAPLLEALFEAGGFPDSRVWFLTGHTVTEVFFDGKYNMLDSDMLGYTTLGQGDPKKSPIASVRELEDDRNIILGKMLAPDKADSARVVYPWYPADVRAEAMGGYAELFTSRKDNWLFPYKRYPGGHSMDFMLRQGERLVRFFKPESERLYYLPYKNVGKTFQEFPVEHSRYDIRTDDGPKSQKDYRRWSTGRIEYTPPLWEKSAYYPVSAPGFNNNLSLPSGPNEPLRRENAALPGAAVFEMPSPYVLIDARISLYAELTTAANRLAIETSTDWGRSWQPAGTINGPFTGPWEVGSRVLATSEHGSLTAVSGAYGYLVRLTLSGPAGTDGGAKARDLKLTSLIQLNPRTLPALVTGDNELLYSPGQKRKKYAVPVALDRIQEFARRIEGLECLFEADNILLKPRSQARGEAIFALTAPDSAKLAGFQAGGRFLVLDRLAPEKLTAELRKTAHNSRSPAKARGSIAWALSPDGPYMTLWEYDPGMSWLDGKPETRLLRWPEVDRLVSELPADTKTVYLRYRLEDMALDDIRLAFFTTGPASFSRLEITHEWILDNVRKSQTIEIGEPGKEKSYQINTGRRGTVENLALILSCPVER